MRYVIYGAGAVGGVLGAHLALGGHDVVMIARERHVRAIESRGLELLGIREEANIGVTATSAIETLSPGPETVLLLTMKTHDTAAALAQLPSWFGEVPVVCCQNSVRNEDLCVAQNLKTAGAVVVVGASVAGPGRVQYTSHGHVYVGSVSEVADGPVDRIVADLSSSGFDSRRVPDIMAHKWAKLLRNLSNAYMALVGISIQESMADERHRRFIADVIEEALAVLRVAGIQYEPRGGSYEWWIARKAGADAERGDGTIEAELEDMRRAGPRKVDQHAASYASTHQDLAAGRSRTEVEFFNGEIVRRGRDVGVSTPMNAVLLEQCEAAARSQLGPGAESASSLRGRVEETARP